MKTRKAVRVLVDNYTRICLTVIAGLMTVLIVALWAHAPIGDQAYAVDGIVTGAEQRTSMIDLQKVTNQKLDELIDLFKSGQVKVQVVQEAQSKSDDSNNK